VAATEGSRPPQDPEQLKASYTDLPKKAKMDTARNGDLSVSSGNLLLHIHKLKAMRWRDTLVTVIEEEPRLWISRFQPQ